MVHVQGTPEGINTYPASRKEIWAYGNSSVTFSLPEGLVTEWRDPRGNLKVRLVPRTNQPTTSGYFTRGSSQDDVVHVQGTPEGINTYPASRKEIWAYGNSSVTFSLPEGLVTEWRDPRGNLKVRLVTRTNQPTTSGYFTRGSSQDDVVHVQGTPEGINTYPASRKEIWAYGNSSVTFSLPEGLVTEWRDPRGNLKVR